MWREQVFLLDTHSFSWIFIFTKKEIKLPIEISCGISCCKTVELDLVISVFSDQHITNHSFRL